MRTMKIAILALGLAAFATTGCGKKKDPAAPAPAATETTTEGGGDSANPCGGGDTAPNPCNPCGGADPCGGGE